MSAREFREPKSISFDAHRWYVDITIVDRFGVTQVFRVGGDEDGSLSDGVYLSAIDTATGKDVLE